MAALYQVLEAGKIGIFESPTGTVSMTSGGPRRSGETLMTSQRPPEHAHLPAQRVMV